MSLENVVGFWQSLNANPSLHDEVKRLSKNKEEWALEIVRLAGSLGLAVSKEEVLETEAVIAFWQRVDSDTALQARLKPGRAMQSAEHAAAEVVKIAREEGYVFSADSLKRITKAYADAQTGRAGHELSQEQLENVAAGAAHPLSFTSIGGSPGVKSPRIGNYVWIGN